MPGRHRVEEHEEASEAMSFTSIRALSCEATGLGLRFRYRIIAERTIVAWKWYGKMISETSRAEFVGDNTVWYEDLGEAGLRRASTRDEHVLADYLATCRYRGEVE